MASAENIEACEEFGKDWDEEIQECKDCFEAVPEEYEECKKLTLEKKTQGKIAESGLVEVEKKVEIEEEKKVDEPEELEKNVEERSCLGVVCHFKELSKARAVFFSLVKKSGKYVRKDLVNSIVEDTGITKSVVSMYISDWQNPKYRPGWMHSVTKDSEGRICYER